MTIEFTGEAIDQRLRQVSRMAGSLCPDARLETKVDLTAEGVAARLKQASDLLDLCRLLHHSSAPTFSTGGPEDGRGER